MTTMIMTLVFCLFSLVAGVDIPYNLTNLEKTLAIIASNTTPILPSPVLATAIFFVFFPSFAARIASAWGRLAHWGRTHDRFGTPATLRIFAAVVGFLDAIFSAFRLEDWQKRSREAEDKFAVAEEHLAVVRTAAAKTELALEEALARLEKLDALEKRIRNLS